MNYYSKSIATFLVLCVLGSTAFPAAITRLRGGAETSTDATTGVQSFLTAPAAGDVFTFFSDVSYTEQSSANGNTSAAETPMYYQSDVAGTQRTITCANADGKRFMDFASGYFDLTDLRFYRCGTSDLSILGGVFYRDSAPDSHYIFHNVTFEENMGGSGSSLGCGALDMYVSGTYTMKNNKAKSGGAINASQTLFLTGDGSVGTFVGNGLYDSKTDTTRTPNDINASAIQIQDAGTYSFEGGLTAKTLTIDRAAVTFETNAVSKITGAATFQNGAAVTLKSGTTTTFGTLTVSDTATLSVDSGATFNVSTFTNNGTLTLLPGTVFKNVSSFKNDGTVSATGDIQLQNLTNTAATTSANIAAGGNLTLYNTVDTTYTGTLAVTENLIKTGANQLTLGRGNTWKNLYAREGTLKLQYPTGSTGDYLSGDVYLDGGTFQMDVAIKNVNTDAGGHRFYVTEKGGTLFASGESRTYIQNGIQSPDGVQSGNLSYTNGRLFIAGTSNFNGDFIVKGGVVHFTESAMTGISGDFILDGGMLQFFGEGLPSGQSTALSKDILIGNSGGKIQCGWSGSFRLTGTISDAAETSSGILSITSDSGLVCLNGTVNLRNTLNLYANLTTESTNPITVGGLRNFNTPTFNSTADTVLTLDMPSERTETYNGKLTGKFQLVKKGEGTQIFAASLANTNGTNVEAGTLKLTGGAGLGAGAVTVGKDGQLLLDTGTYDLSNVAGLNLDGKLTLTIKSTEDYTKVRLPTTLTQAAGGGLSFDFEGYDWSADDTFRLSDAIPLGDDYDYKSLLAPGDRYYWNLAANNGGLELSLDRNAVPEPAAWALALLGGVGLWSLRRKSRAEK